MKINLPLLFWHSFISIFYLHYIFFLSFSNNHTYNLYIYMCHPLPTLKHDSEFLEDKKTVLLILVCWIPCPIWQRINIQSMFTQKYKNNTKTQNLNKAFNSIQSTFTTIWMLENMLLLLILNVIICIYMIFPFYHSGSKKAPSMFIILFQPTDATISLKILQTNSL